ncbi:hypothetical protein Tco_1393040 [Tanacetum coccineum]
MFESGSYRSHSDHATLYQALEASMDCDNREEFLEATTKSRKIRRDDQDPPPPPLKESERSKKKKQDSNAPASKQPPVQKSSAWKTSNTREEDVNLLKSEDTGVTHLLKIKTRPDWLKPIPKEETPKHLNQTGLFLQMTYLRLRTTGLIQWPKYWEKKLVKPDFEGQAYKVVRPFHKNNISLQFQMKECHLLLTDQIDLMNPEGNRVVHDVSKPLPLGGPPGQITIQPQYFFNKDLKYLVSGDKERRHALSISKLKAAYYLDFGLEELVPNLWAKREREYDISAAYGISLLWFKPKEFYITRHSAPSDRSAVRSHMRILRGCVISEADFKNLHPNDFEDLKLLHLQGKLDHLSGADKVHLSTAVNMWTRNIVFRQRVEDLQLRIKSYQTKLNLTQLRRDSTDFLFKEDYTIIHKPRSIIYRDRNNQKKMMWETDVHKFNDGTLTRILEKLDYMVKDYELVKFNPGMENRIWT